jgi:methionyl-tRNA formyltransferase
LNARRDATAAGRPPQRLRVVLCTRGGLYGALVLRRLRACDRLEVCGIVRSSRMFDPSFGFLRGSLAYLRRSGIAYSLYLWCATTLADVLCGVAPIGQVPMRTRAGGVRVHTTRNVNDPEALRFLTDCAPDLLVSAFFDQRLQEGALAVASYGCVNIHPSLLPLFRGVDPVLQARLATARTGVSVHYMTPTLDAGALLAQQSLVNSESASIFSATARSFGAGAALLAGVIEQVARKEAGIPQEAPGTYQSWPSRADIRALRRHKAALIRLSDLAAIFSA